MSASCSNADTDDTCDFECNYGYEKDGELKCIGVGNNSNAWDYADVACNPSSCGNFNFTLIPHSNATSKGANCAPGQTEQTCTFNCNYGYSKSSGSVQCKGSGIATSTWMHSVTCNAVQCPTLASGTIPNAIYVCTGTKTDETCDFSCDDGYVKSGSIACVGDTLSTSKWSYAGASCTAKQCDPIDWDMIDHENSTSICSDKVSGDECDFECEYGYEKSGPLTCFGLPNGQNEWDYPTCEPMPCTTPDSQMIAYSNETQIESDCADLVTGDECEFECMKGFSKAGPALTCQGTSTGNEWNYQGVTCDAMTCPNVNTILNGIPHLNVSTSSCTNIQTGGACGFSCNSGYVPSGSIICLGTEWLSTASCDALSCGNVFDYVSGANLSTATSHCFDGHPGEVCNYACNNGYQPEGIPVMCIGSGGSAIWNTSSTSCDAKVCPQVNTTMIPFMDTTTIESCDNLHTDESCTFGCIPGYGPTGEIQCLGTSDGNNALNYPECTPTPCYNFNVSSIWKANASRPTTHCTFARVNETCSFHCDSGYGLVGSVVCVEGEWVSDASCGILTCNPPNFSEVPLSIPNAPCDIMQTGDTCAFTCQNGSVPTGQLRCVSVGDELVDWDYGSASCTPADCGAFDFSQIDLATTSAHCTGSKFGDSCGFACNGTYVATGRIPCVGVLGGAVWDYAAATCDTKCSPYSVVGTHGNASTLSNLCFDGVLNDECDWECNDGYTTEEGSTVCTNSGWENTRDCTPKSCGPVELNEEGINPSASCANLLMDQTCTYSCNSGYFHNGSTSCVYIGGDVEIVDNQGCYPVPTPCQLHPCPGGASCAPNMADSYNRTCTCPGALEYNPTSNICYDPCDCGNTPPISLTSCESCAGGSNCTSCCNYLATSAQAICAYVGFYKAKQADKNLVTVLEEKCAFKPNQYCSGNCSDHIKGGIETAPDCGGNCPTCENGFGCLNNSDCTTGFCGGNSTTKYCAPVPTKKKKNGGGFEGYVIIILPIVAACCCFCCLLGLWRRKKEEEEKEKVVKLQDPEYAARGSGAIDLRPDETELAQFGDPPPLTTGDDEDYNRQY